MKRLYGFNNKVKIFLETSTIPNNINPNELYLLNKLYVLYKINIPNGMIYIGYTQDFGQRMNSHNKCGRNLEKKLYNDIRKYGECTFEIMGIYNNEEEAEKNETLLINQYVDKYLNEKFGKLLPLIYKEERLSYLFNKIYNKNKIQC